VSDWQGVGDQRGQLLRDALAIFWVLLWLVVGGLVAIQVWSLSNISDAAEASAVAADDAGQALQELSELPLVGDGPGELGTSVREAAAEVEQNAAQTRRDVRRLSVLLGLAVAALPTTPLLALYVPQRRAFRRHVAAVRRELSEHGRTPALDAYLAHRAVAALSYGELYTVTTDPVRDLLMGRHEALADVELSRLGLPLHRTGSEPRE
jgi:hypothetical protein